MSTSAKTSSDSLTSTSSSTMFEVHVAKDTFKFTAAHFVAYRGFRERLHGHNYQVSVRLLAGRRIGPDGYVIDFGCIKSVTKQVCKELNEHFLCPTLSNVLDITTTTTTTNAATTSNTTATTNTSSEEEEESSSVMLKCEDGSVFVFPKDDCAMLPIVHATAEELAIYLWGRILDGLGGASYLVQRGIHTMEVTVAEAIGQDATFRREIIPNNVNDNGNNGAEHFDVGQYIMGGNVVPMPCPSSSNPHYDRRSRDRHQTKETKCRGENCSCSRQVDFSSKLQQLADMINSGKLNTDQCQPITAKDLESLIGASHKPVAN